MPYRRVAEAVTMCVCIVVMCALPLCGCQTVDLYAAIETARENIYREMTAKSFSRDMALAKSEKKTDRLQEMVTFLEQRANEMAKVGRLSVNEKELQREVRQQAKTRKAQMAHMHTLMERLQRELRAYRDSTEDIIGFQQQVYGRKIAELEK